MKINIPFEIMFGIGILLFTFSVFVYGLIIKRLLTLIERKGIWILPVVGSFFLLLSTVIHFYRVFYYGGLVSRADPMDLFPTILEMLRVNSLEAYSILTAGLLILIGSLVYYRWISK